MAKLTVYKTTNRKKYWNEFVVFMNKEDVKKRKIKKCGLNIIFWRIIIPIYALIFVYYLWQFGTTKQLIPHIQALLQTYLCPLITFIILLLLFAISIIHYWRIRAIVQNPLIKDLVCPCTCSVKGSLIFKDGVKEGSVEVDQSIREAVGVFACDKKNENELEESSCKVNILPLSFKFWEPMYNAFSYIFGRRYLIVNVTSAEKVYMEKNLCTLPEGAFPILGCESGDKIVISSYIRKMFLSKSKGNNSFLYKKNDFKDKTIKDLCEKIIHDCSQPNDLHKSYSIEWLNSKLESPELKDVLINKFENLYKNKKLYTPILNLISEITEYIKFDAFKSSESKKESIRKLNRLLLDTIYPEETPNGDFTMNRDFCITPAPLIFVSSLLLFMFTLSHWGSSFIFYD